MDFASKRHHRHYEMLFPCACAYSSVGPKNDSDKHNPFSDKHNFFLTITIYRMEWQRMTDPIPPLTHFTHFTTCKGSRSRLYNFQINSGKLRGNVDLLSPCIRTLSEGIDSFRNKRKYSNRNELTRSTTNLLYYHTCNYGRKKDIRE